MGNKSSFSREPFVSIAGIEDPYHNSFISPYSAKEAVARESEAADMTSGQSEIALPGATSESKTLLSSSESPIVIATHERQVRSASPVLHRTASLDDLLYKNVGDSLDSNDVELSGRVVQFIQPTRTVKEDTNESASGEASGAPQGRSIPLTEPQDITPTATMTGSFATRSPQPGRPRQANPDIQDIITGIVKLLNGNANNGQANTSPPIARPGRPQSTRINNRGPPRITDVPALPPDFDIPAPPVPPPPLGQMPPPVSSTRMPTPYPFDIPPQNTSPVRPYVNGIPLPEPVIPASSKRPGVYRPVTIPPWSRPPHRRPLPHRRPTIPHYKPLPSYNPDSAQISITSDKPAEDILTLDLGAQLEPASGHDDEYSNYTNSEKDIANKEETDETVEETTIADQHDAEETTVVPDQETLEFERNKEKSSSKMDKHTSKSEMNLATTSSIFNSSFAALSLPEQANSTLLSPTPSTETTLEATTINTTVIDIVTLNDTSLHASGIGEATPVLEASIQEVLQTLKDGLLEPSTISSTPTEVLPAIKTSESTKRTSTPIAPTESSASGKPPTQKQRLH